MQHQSARSTTEAKPSPALDIVAVVGDFPAVSKTFVVDQLLALIERGHRVRILADPPHSPTTTVEDLPPQLRGLVTYRRRPDERQLGTRRRFAVALARGLRAAPVATIRVLSDRARSRYRRLLILETVIALAHIGEVHVYHCHFGPAGADIADALPSLGFRGRIVTAFHGYDITSHLARTTDDVFDSLFVAGDLFLPVSERWRERLIELGAPPERVEVQRMGVDVGQFDPEPVRRDRVELRVLSIGRLVEKKGFEFGLRAIAALRDRGVGIRYTIIGEGPLRPRLEELVDELGLGDIASLVGSQEREQVREQLASSDVLLCPSITAENGDSEGIPMVLMEAMATGLPVVASRHSGIPELVRPDVSGLLADERDVLGLADQLHAIQADPQLAQRLGISGREVVEAEFDISALMKQLEERLQRVVSRQ